MRVLVAIPVPSDMPHFDADATWHRLNPQLATYDRLLPPTENALRKWLQNNRADVLHYIGYVTSRGTAFYDTVTFCGSTGAARTIAVAYLKSLLAQHSMRLVVTNITQLPLVFAADFYERDAPSAPPARLAEPPPPPPPPVMTDETPRDDPHRELQRKRAGEEFDVFLCYHTADKPRVREIAAALEQRGVLPWLDEHELRPGVPWVPLLERQIEKIKSAAVFVGGTGIGPWQQQEIYGLLHEFSRRQTPVIPVLLPEATVEPMLPLFLQSMTWVDFRTGDPEPLEQLIWGITGKRPTT
ncbi:MAG TPA: toll/interleukin-1 receptor domain-containing protein [Thermoanaerobaculia bacterium]|nr:toll/interleukin-1 receptor domain-containing protein [Thermoanaerobaculia bacterium]